MWKPTSDPSEMDCLLRLATRLTGMSDAGRVGEQALDELHDCLPGTTWAMLVREVDGTYALCAAGRLGAENLAALATSAGVDAVRCAPEALTAIPFEQRPRYACWPNGAAAPEVVLGTFVDPGARAPSLTLLACAAQLCGHAVRTLRELGRLRVESDTDPLTGVQNRRAILERLTAERGWAAERGLPLAVLFIDLDRFKAVNDTYGHAVGDQLLRAVAHALRSVLRASDAVGRVGGDEFLVILPGAGPSAAARLAESLEALVAATELVAGGARLRPSVTVGVGSGEGDAATLVAAADQAMLARKGVRREVAAVA